MMLTGTSFLFHAAQEQETCFCDQTTLHLQIIFWARVQIMCSTEGEAIELKYMLTPTWAVLPEVGNVFIAHSHSAVLLTFWRIGYAAFMPKIGVHCSHASGFQKEPTQLAHASWILRTSFNRMGSFGSFSALHLINHTVGLQAARTSLAVQWEGSGITQNPLRALVSLSRLGLGCEVGKRLYLGSQSPK